MKKSLFFTLIFAAALCLILAIPALAAGDAFMLPYGFVSFDNGLCEATLQYKGETLNVYAMAPGGVYANPDEPYNAMHKFGISEQTVIDVYTANVSGGSATAGALRFHREADHFREIGFGYGTTYNYYFDPEDIGLYCLIEINEKDLGAVTRFFVHCVDQANLPKPAEGKCGPNVSYELTGDVLHIRGTGPMYNYPSESGDSPPYGDSGFTSVVIHEGVTSVGADAFRGVFSLEQVTFPDSLVYIGPYAFNGDWTLKDFTLPKNLKHIGTCAFMLCDGLTCIELPDSVESVWRSAFAFCSSLERVVWSKNATVIPSGAFNFDSKLGSLTLPSTVTLIGENAISIPDGRKADVFYGGTEAQWNALEKTNCVFGDGVTFHFRESPAGVSAKAEKPAIADGKIETSVYIAETVENAKVLCAIYKNGHFTGLELREVSPGWNDLTFGMLSGGTEVRVFVVDGGFSPLCEPARTAV